MNQLTPDDDMPLEKNAFYPSDEISALNGFDGTESRDMLVWCREFSAQFPTRVVFAINQYYPELQSGYYFNKTLVALIQGAISSLGLSVVIEDNYRSEGIVPVEPWASLEYADDYLLVDDILEIRGRLRMWESLGGRSAFYHDKVVLEVLTVAKIVDELLEAIQEECRLHKVTFVGHVLKSGKEKSYLNVERRTEGRVLERSGLNVERKIEGS